MFMNGSNRLCLATAVAGSMVIVFISFAVPVCLLGINATRIGLVGVGASPAIVAGAGLPGVATGVPIVQRCHLIARETSNTS